MIYDYFVGVDLGQKSDYTAVCVVEQPIWVSSKWDVHAALPDGWVSPADYEPRARDLFRSYEFHRGGAPSKPTLEVRHLQRFPLGTSYPSIVDQVARLLERAPLNHGTVLLVDATGVGIPVVDLFRQRGLQPLGITITGGRETHRDGDNISVPKRDLVLAAQVALQAGQLKIAEQLVEAPVLVRELLEFKSKISNSGHDTYGADAWRENVHDDLLLALSMSVWFRTWQHAYLDEATEQRARAGSR